MRPQPVALSPALPSELLSYILTHQSHPTTLIICQPRAEFLASLLRCISHVSPNKNPNAPPPTRHHRLDVDDIDLDAAAGTEHEAGGAKTGQSREGDTARHHLLIPTLHQTATSRNIKLVYIPSVSHLRAYLSVFSQDLQEQYKTQAFSKTGTKTPLLVIYGLLECHRHTSEWSAQGVGITLSALVDAGNRTGRKVVLIEELDGAVERDGMARKDNIQRGWEEKLPILNGSVRRAGVESEEGSWSGRTVEMGRVLSRWFRFERADWDDL